MATTDSGRAVSTDQMTVVDVDSHVGESLDELGEYLDERHASVRRFLETDDPLREIYSSTRVTPAFNQTGARHEDTDASDLVHSGDGPDTKRAFMTEYSIDYSVLSPGLNLNLASVNHDQTAVAIANAYNDWLLDTQLDDEDDLTGTLLVAHQRPDRAAEEIDRVASETGIVGIQLPASGLIPPAGHWWFNPIYEAAADHDLPIVMHTGNSGTTSAFPVQRYWAETFLEDHAFTFPIEAMWHLISIVCNGVPERFPGLEFIFQETGIEWVPWMSWRLDDHYLQNSEDVPSLSKPPSEYIRDQFYFGTQPLGHTEQTGHLANVIAAAGGPETVLFATDHPHADFDLPNEVLAPLRANFEDEEIRDMMGGTAMKVFDL